LEEPRSRADNSGAAGCGAANGVAQASSDERARTLDLAAPELILDGNAQDAERKSLIIRPARRLAPGKRYIVAMRNLKYLWLDHPA
jgi:hypothetical protein